MARVWCCPGTSAHNDHGGTWYDYAGSQKVSVSFKDREAAWSAVLFTPVRVILSLCIDDEAGGSFAGLTVTTKASVASSGLFKGKNWATGLSLLELLQDLDAVYLVTRLRKEINHYTDSKVTFYYSFIKQNSIYNDCPQPSTSRVSWERLFGKGVSVCKAWGREAWVG